MLGSARLWVERRRIRVLTVTLTDLFITAIILATTGVRSQHTWHPMRAPPWTSLGYSIAQPVRSEQDTNNSLLCQCLHTNTIAQSYDSCHEAENICSDFPSNRLTRLLWNPSPQFSSACWAREDSCLPPVLSQTQINLIESESKAECRCAVEEVLQNLQKINEEMRKSLEVLLSVHMMTDCQTCEDWYRSWFCLSSWPVYRGDKVVSLCPTECSQVQSSCPFLTILEDASLAAGDPTFLCQDSSIFSSSDQTEFHETCCYQLLSASDDCKPQATGDIPVPREGEYVDLNTSCHHPLQVREGSNLSECLGPSASTSLTQLCDSSVASGQITLANRTLLITLSHTSSGGSLPVTTTTTTNIIIYYAVYSQFYS